MSFWPWRRGCMTVACSLAVTHVHSASGQRNGSTHNASYNISTSSTDTTTTVPEQDWPACPARGCLPCPENAEGRPNCTCVEGYSLTGQPSDAEQLIPWGEVRGWLGRCLPVACGVPPVLPHAVRVDSVHVDDALVFPEIASYVCDDGYKADGEESRDGFMVIYTNASDTSERLIETQCTANGTLSSAASMLCVPVCGDGRLMPTDHLPMYDLREQCDDGNRLSGDGCSLKCAVEPDFVCAGGSPHSPDSCQAVEVWATSVLVLRITGHRAPREQEIGDATILAMAEAIGCPQRDLEVIQIKMSTGQGGLADGSTTTVPATTSQSSSFHGSELSVEILFRVKISDAEQVTIDHVLGMLRTPSLMKPKLWVAFADRTSFLDLYVQVVDVREPTLHGDEEKGAPKGFTLSGEIKAYAILLSPVYSYIFLISVIAPSLIWFSRVRRRKYRLAGRYGDIAPEFKGNWAFNICTCLESKCLFVSLICCLPARLADTWDAMGFLTFWMGVRRAMCCCILYLIPGFGCCGAFIPGHYRSEMRDFFGFGDGKGGNTEFADYCCYVLCPLCCIVQEARHVDTALAILPPPQDQQSMEFQYAIHEFDEPHAPDTRNPASNQA